MNINDTFPSTYVKAGDLGGQEVVVTMDEVKQEAIGRTKEKKPVLYFVGKTKGLVLNKTNANKIAAIVGSEETEEWHGKKIKLYPTETEFGGETVECIRIKAVMSTNGKMKPTVPAKPVKKAVKAKVVEPEPDDALPEPGEMADAEDVVDEGFDPDEPPF